MRHFKNAAGCSLMVLVLMSQGLLGQSLAQEGAKPKSKPAVEKAEKSEPAVKKSESAVKKSESAVKKPETAKSESKPAVKESTAAEKKPQTPAKTAPPAADKPKPGPATYTVTPELFRVQISVDGVFEAQKMTEIVLKPKSWTSFKTTEAVKHGTTVSKGGVLVAFDSKTIDEAVADHQVSLTLAKLSMKQAQASLKMAEATTPMDLARAARQQRESLEDLARYLKVDKPMRKKRADFSLKSDENYLEYELEELKQLEKMYEADDMTEETEEIILKRQRHAVERARYYLESGKIQHKQTLEISMPRIEEAMKNANRLVELATERSKTTLPIALEQQRLEMEKLEVQMARSEEKLEKLLADQKLMTVKSPVAGLVYYGKCVRGKWSGGTSAADKLTTGKSVSANSVLMTIVSPRPMVVRATVPEKDLHWFRPGLRGTLRAAASPDTRATTTISEVETIPGPDGKFGIVLRATLDSEADALMPGMSCKVKLIPYQKKRTLTVPVSALETDEFDDSKHYVHLVAADGKSRKQPVAVGKRTAKKIEILDGLVAGDKVLKEYPKDEK